MSYYKRHVFFCTNQREHGRQCCMNHAAMELRNYAKQRTKELGIAGAGGVRVNSAGCLDRCVEGPVCVIYPEQVWYTYADRADIDEIVEQHLVHGKSVARLKI
ncbi:MAG: (2Fe-2S) ferredoxin domain-containing protein [Gammaproteobacteria bacterium]|nr:(2Fe-2S) ferredoxin domain-containing protein [Gammaproteobacteria bacterium]NNF60084.1 (2Fe-2S) ferredoxin domain-containing protein [Gammaproteobacteria bacterium]NNM19860.1 (2Fe-2S) ferredoxin domain-containing protein [Gammaproteobacteria bacterium]